MTDDHEPDPAAPPALPAEPVQRPVLTDEQRRALMLAHYHQQLAYYA